MKIEIGTTIASELSGAFSAGKKGNKYLKISVIIPMHNQHEFTERCVASLYSLADNPDDLDVIVVDGNSNPPYQPVSCEWVIQKPENTGVLDAYKFGMQYAVGDILVWMHNDVLIWENAWDTRIINAFQEDSKLGLAGLFGGRGVSLDGGRGMPESNMIGREWGTHGGYHGQILTTQHPCVVMDSLCMMFRREALEDVGIDERIPRHHWYDRILTLDVIRKGWHAVTLGIAHDHFGGGTSTRTYTPNDLETYQAGERLFQEKHGDILSVGSLWVDEAYNYTIRKG